MTTSEIIEMSKEIGKTYWEIVTRDANRFYKRIIENTKTVKETGELEDKKV